MTERAKIAAEHRDAKAPFQELRWRKGSGRKDTKRWCRGREGRLHKKTWKERRRWYSVSFTSESMELTCDVCGKSFKTWYPRPRWMPSWDPGPKPAVGSREY